MSLNQFEADIMHHFNARLCSSTVILGLAIMSLTTACDDSVRPDQTQSDAASEAATMAAIRVMDFILS